jgi:outer membrane receptor protein involved in Fe transport
VIARADLRLAARWQGFTMTLDVVNVFDRREVTNLDELYTTDSVRPIVGGTAEDLVLLKNDTGAPATRRTAFQLPTSFQPPLSVSLGIHKAF